jgi:cation diffusion facilitator CzcD-associated flavoprotein CzcO
VLFTGVGGLSRWSWPDIPGLKDFKGQVLHSANWDVTSGDRDPWQEGVKDWGNKRVGVIGVVRGGRAGPRSSFRHGTDVFIQGASAIQIVPALQPKVAKVVNYVRGKTWLSAPFAESKLSELVGRTPTGENCTCSIYSCIRSLLTWTR